MVETYTYGKVNDVVNQVFFDGRYESVPVYLDLEDEIRSELAQRLDCAAADIELLIGTTVSRTLDWSCSNIYKTHLKGLRAWNAKSRLGYPPYTTILLTFSLAAEHMRQDSQYSSTNYYQRLFEILGVDDEASKNKARLGAKHTLSFWNSLNRWLMWNDYEYGRPTARRVNNWKYVSFALSQSLVRDADRKRFHRMFAEFGISPHESLSEAEISLYIHEWMTGHGPSEWLKKIWAVPDLRERVASSAIQELECWHGDMQGNNGSSLSIKRLSWTAIIQSFPNKRIKLYLAGASNDGIEESSLKLSDKTPELAAKAFEKCNGNIWLSPLQGANLECIEPVDKLNIDALMLSPFQLVTENGRGCYKHDIRPVIPLIKLESSPYFREVSRVSLHTDHIILCHENWKARVDSHLEKYARSGFVSHNAKDVTGLPEQWIIFQGVEYLSAPQESVEDNLQPIVPLSEGVSIQLTGGLKLSPNIWHSKAPPEILSSDDKGLLELEVSYIALEGEEELQFEQKIKPDNPAFLKSSKIDLDSGTYTVAAIRNSRKVAEKDISFRSAKLPRKLNSSRTQELGYKLNHERRGWWSSALPLNGCKDDTVLLRGMIIEGDHIGPEEGIGSFLTDFDHGLDITHEEEDFWGDYNHDPVKGFAESCILRGYHVWECEPCVSHGDRYSAKHMTCKDCKSSVLSKRVGRGLKRKKNIFRAQARSISGMRIESRSIDNVSPEIVLDAICYLGAGSWRSIESVISAHVELPWQITEFARRLVDLGYIDVTLSEDGRKPVSWSCSPPALVATPNGEVYLSGFRNDTLLEEVASALSGEGCSHRVVKQELAPPAYVWELSNLTITDVEGLLGNIKDPHGRKIKVVNSPASSINNFMPSIYEMKQMLRPIHIEDQGDIERFDPKTGRWSKHPLKGVGGYRTSFAGRRYFYLNEHGESYEAGYEVVKLIAARDAGIRLHGYNKGTGNLECIIGCEPPDLYRRMLISCSGLVPERGEWKLTFSGVSEELAKALITKLYS
ncbi:hypothetical protein [Amphritea sp. HPY]|uniref:hypothetical protein n=1 Tax=Amphritea sp. HPY TaxID=3421652 RepID=UPI003D7DE686